MEEHGGKVRFGVVGTNFITDWVIAGARQDDRFELVAVYSRKQGDGGCLCRQTSDTLYFYLFWKRWQKAQVDRCRVYSIA